MLRLARLALQHMQMPTPKLDYPQLQKSKSTSSEPYGKTIQLGRVLIWSGKPRFSLEVRRTTNIISIIYFFEKTMRTHEEIRQEERKALEKLLLALSQHRKMPRAEYLERVTRDYELRLQYEQSTLFLALDIVGGKSFRRQVCDFGQHCLQNDLLAGDIFQAFKQTPENFQVDLHRGVLIMKIKFMLGRREKILRKEIEMKELQLCAGIRQEIKFGRVARECLKHLGGEDKESLRRKYEEKEKKYLKEIEELRAQLQKPVAFKNPRIEPIKKAITDPESLVMETPHRHRFLIRANTITLQQQGNWLGDWYQVLLGEVLSRTRPFVLIVTITNTNYGNLTIGVVDRRTQGEEKSSYNSSNAVCYNCRIPYIKYEDVVKFAMPIMENRKAKTQVFAYRQGQC